MSQIRMILPKGQYELRELIKEIAKQNLNLIVMEEYKWIQYHLYNEIHIIGSYGDLNLCDQIRERLTPEEIDSCWYDSDDRQLIWRIEVGNEGKVFYNISAELAEQLMN